MKRIMFFGLLTLALLFSLLVTPMAVNAQAGDDIVDTAVNAGEFPTLVAAVQAAELVDTLKSEGPFTVFAPTEAAFAALPDGTIEALLADPTGDLANILLFHVVPGKVMAADLSDGLVATTALGVPVTFKISDSGAMVENANIVAADIEAANGVIHVIDAVILPPSSEAPEMLPVTGGTASNVTYMALFAVLGLLLVGAYVTRTNQSGA
jgi:uncharacterized surface protein with fasciclin (FAS1) repeats